LYALKKDKTKNINSVSRIKPLMSKQISQFSNVFIWYIQSHFYETLSFS